MESCLLYTSSIQRRLLAYLARLTTIQILLISKSPKNAILFYKTVQVAFRVLIEDIYNNSQFKTTNYILFVNPQSKMNIVKLWEDSRACGGTMPSTHFRALLRTNNTRASRTPYQLDKCTALPKRVKDFRMFLSKLNFYLVSSLKLLTNRLYLTPSCLIRRPKNHGSLGGLKLSKRLKRPISSWQALHF